LGYPTGLDLRIARVPGAGPRTRRMACSTEWAASTPVSSCRAWPGSLTRCQPGLSSKRGAFAAIGPSC
jgi:hypothetical protein